MLCSAPLKECFQHQLCLDSAFQTSRMLQVDMALRAPAGLHGAKVVITGRREQVLADSCGALSAEGIAALGVQVRSI